MRKKYLGYKKLQGGGKKPIRKTGKKVATFFFFGDSKKKLGAAKDQQGAPNGNVTPRDITKTAMTIYMVLSC